MAKSLPLTPISSNRSSLHADLLLYIQRSHFLNFSQPIENWQQVGPFTFWDHTGDILEISWRHLGVGDIIWISWGYFWDILGISLGYIGGILGISYKYLVNILDISWGYLGDINGISLGYIGNAFGMSLEVISWDNIKFPLYTQDSWVYKGNFWGDILRIDRFDTNYIHTSAMLMFGPKKIPKNKSCQIIVIQEKEKFQKTFQRL